MNFFENMKIFYHNSYYFIIVILIKNMEASNSDVSIFLNLLSNCLIVSFGNHDTLAVDYINAISGVVNSYTLKVEDHLVAV